MTPPASARSRAAAWPSLALFVALSTGCASARLPPPVAVSDAARKAATYSARVRVSLRGPDLRARTPALLAFKRPGALRIEVPGPAGARLVAVVVPERLVAVFPGERAFYEGNAREEELEALLGVRLTPSEVMDVLVGAGSPRLRRYDVRWGADLPRDIQATLPDGARLSLKVEEADMGRDLPDQAFATPAHEGYRVLSLEEARRLFSR